MILELFIANRVQVHLHYFFLWCFLIIYHDLYRTTSTGRTSSCLSLFWRHSDVSILFFVRVIVSIWSTYTKIWYFLQSGPWSCKVSERYIIRLFQDHKGNFNVTQQDLSPEKGKKSSFFCSCSTDNCVVFVPRNCYNDAFFSSAGLRSWWSW